MRAFPPITPSGPPQVVWFKRDLRVGDHAALAHASAAGPVLCVYAVELEHWHQPCISDRQWQFVRVMLPLFCGVLSSLLTRLFCAVPRTSVSRIAWG